MRYSLIIPAYNESARIGATLDIVVGYIAQQRCDAEVLIVNDGSRDDTAAIVRRYASSHPEIRLLENDANRGKGYSVRHGMMEATGDYLLFSDADLSAPLDEAAKLFAALDRGEDVAIGSRWLNPELQTVRQPLYRQLFGRIFNLLLRLVLRLKFRDTQCGFKAFRREAARKVFSLQRIERWAFDPEILYLARHFGYRIEEVPVRWSHDSGTRLHPVRDGFVMAGEVLRIRWYSLTGAYRPPSA